MRPRNLRLTGRAQRGREQPPSPERSMQPEAESPEVEPEVPLADRPVVDTALYRDGQRIASPGSLAATYRQLAAEPGATAWIGLYRPGRGELQAAAEEFGLHPLAVEDAIVAHQRPSRREGSGQAVGAQRHLDLADRERRVAESRDGPRGEVLAVHRAGAGR